MINQFHQKEIHNARIKINFLRYGMLDALQHMITTEQRGI